MDNSLTFRDDEAVSDVVMRHMQNRIPDLIGAKRSVTFRMDLYDHARLNWLADSLGVHKSVLIRDLLAAAMADAIKSLIPDEQERKDLYEIFEVDARKMADSDSDEGEG